MRRLRFLMSLLLVVVSINAFSADSEYNAESKVLTIPVIKVGNAFVYDAKLKLNDKGSFDIVGFSDQPPSVIVDSQCVEAQITIDKFSQISVGMSLNQVSSIIGCKEKIFAATSSFTIYTWNDGSGRPEIQVSIRNSVVFTTTYLPE